MYDVIVVGARVAGSATALLLARRGHRVLLVDRATFPSDTMSTHYIHPTGVRHLRDLGVLEAVCGSGAPPIRQARFDVGPVVLQGAPTPAGDVGQMFCPRRTVLDKLLLDAAATAGAEVREAFVVDDLRWSNGRVGGIRGRHSGGTVTERAAVVVGADGRNSLVARLAQAPAYAEVAPLTCAYYSYWSGVEMHGVEFYARPGRAIAAMPTHDGLTCVYLAAPRAQFHTFRHGVEAAFTASLALVPELADRLSGGQRAERYRGTADLPNFLRRPFGPGWALVGDAGCHKDPLLAHGISDALRDAHLLAQALDAALCGTATPELALAEYQRARDDAELPAYRLTTTLAALAPLPPPLVQLLESLVHDSAGTARFLGAIAGTVPVGEFFGASPATAPV